MSLFIADTGLLKAFLDRNDRHHSLGQGSVSQTRSVGNVRSRGVGNRAFERQPAESDAIGEAGRPANSFCGGARSHSAGGVARQVSRLRNGFGRCLSGAHNGSSANGFLLIS